MTESWNIIEENNLYEVSNLGNVRRVGGLNLKPKKTNKGYLCVSLSRNSVVKTKTIHRLACIAFHGPANGMIVNHRDGNKCNNRADNLEWVTYSENNAHAFSTGLRKPTPTNRETSKHSKLSLQKAREIRDLKGTLSGVALAALYGVSPQVISKVITGKTWL